jgi:hypothetical protein
MGWRAAAELRRSAAPWAGRRKGSCASAANKRRLGSGGRKKKAFEDPTLAADLKELVEPATRGDPMQPLLWTTRSLRNLVKELGRKGIRFAQRWSAIRCAAIACRRTAKLEKATSISIAMPSFITSTRRPRRFWLRTNRLCQ